MYGSGFRLFYVKKHGVLPTVCLVTADTAIRYSWPLRKCRTIRLRLLELSSCNDTALLALLRIVGKSSLKKAKGFSFNLNVMELFFEPCLQVLEEAELNLHVCLSSNSAEQVPLFPKS